VEWGFYVFAAGRVVNPMEEPEVAVLKVFSKWFPRVAEFLSVVEGDLKGLRRVVVMRRPSRRMVEEWSETDPWLRGRSDAVSRVKGVYVEDRRMIILFVDAIERCAAAHGTSVAEEFARSLYHEVGHHAYRHLEVENVDVVEELAEQYAEAKLKQAQNLDIL